MRWRLRLTRSQIASDAHLHGGNLEKGFIIGGVSGGGTYTSIAALLARDDQLEPPITGVFLLCPVLSTDRPPKDAPPKISVDASYAEMFPGRVRSHKQNAEAPLMTRAMQEAIYGTYSTPPPTGLVCCHNFGAD